RSSSSAIFPCPPAITTRMPPAYVPGHQQKKRRRQRDMLRLCCADLLVVAGPFAVAQDEFLDLAGGGLRQRPEFDRVGAFVVGEALAAERDDLLRRCRGAVVERDERLGPLSPVGMGGADDRALEHGGVGGDGLLDLDAGDVLAAGDDDVLAAVAQLDGAVGGPDRPAPGGEPATAEGPASGGRVVELPAPHVVCADDARAHPPPA